MAEAHGLENAGGHRNWLQLKHFELTMTWGDARISQACYKRHAMRSLLENEMWGRLLTVINSSAYGETDAWTNTKTTTSDWRLRNLMA